MNGSGQSTFSTYLDKLENLGIEPSLSGILALCRELDDPQTKFDLIQVTGTNGKTSTSRIIQSLLTAHGQRVGVYTSPHLISYRERIMVDGAEIAEDDFADIGRLVQDKVDAAEAALDGRKITQFEVLTATALAYFAFKARVDVAVLEVGMGARWDATSVGDPKVGVITNVSLDHADWLGPEIADIAAEKAYVIKENNRVAIGPVSTEVMTIFEKRAHDVNASLLRYGSDFEVAASTGKLIFSTPLGAYKDIDLPPGGPWQADNALLGTVSAEAYLKRALEIDKVRAVLFNSTVPGRAELIRSRPDLLLDGAHNPAGVERFLQFLNSEYDDRRLVFLISILKDKEASAMVESICRINAEIIFTASDNTRVSDPIVLAKIAKSLGARAISVTDPREGLEKAKSIAGRKGLV
ncbi:MAG: bifunctional folylpolyglutamate synthase/dihydrofolate synthase, partial [Actinomycetia bacterium]|nr:bifunctional folylpolyglutamate synthase/dihydrofolate synthase [Actinomycetes bacterium]